MRKYCAIIIALLMASCISPSRNENNLRVLYWNIQNGMWDGQTDNYVRFTNWVAAQDPDICVWCESVSLYYSNTADVLPQEERFLPDSWKELASRYGHQYVYMGGHRDDYPQVITSRYPIENVSRIIGNEADSVVTHGAGWAKVVVFGKSLNIVTLHTWPQRYAFRVPVEEREANKLMDGGHKYRRMEIEYICKETVGKSEKAGEEYWMMMGDFNAKSRADNWFYKFRDDTAAFLVHDYISAHTPYIDVIKEKYPKEFITTTGGESRIDFFYCTAPLYEKISVAEVISDEYTTPVRNPQKISNFWHPSDHRPILVEFVF